MKIAVIGSGISGLACAYYLHREHDVHVIESQSRLGGHTATVDVAVGGRRLAIDTGFIVYNDWTYPNFIALLDELGVSSRDTQMGFSLSDVDSGLEYAGASLNSLFAQRRNLVSPSFLGMIRDILRFNREAIEDLEAGRVHETLTLGEYLQERRYSKKFIDYYLIPMGSAIWSADTPIMMDFPLTFFVRFFANHGLLSLKKRPQWRVIEGGSREYIRPLTVGYEQNIRLDTRVKYVRRDEDGAVLVFSDGVEERFDTVVFSCHSDQALELLSDPSNAEKQVLSGIPYQENDVVLHTDTRLLPRNPRTWSSWNYRRDSSTERATLTYNMNILQGLEASETFCVTLNDSALINPHKVLGQFNYSHPVFSLQSLQAQGRWGEVSNGTTWYCGAYWGNGFHEDGVVSALRAAKGIQAQTATQAHGQAA